MDDFSQDCGVIEAFRFVDAFGEQVTSLLRKVVNETIDEISKRKDDLNLVVRSKGDYSVAKNSSSEWTCVAESRSLPLSKPDGRARQPFAYLNFEVVLDGDGLVPGVAMPVMHVSFWDAPTSYEGDEYYVGFPPDERPEIVADRLLAWMNEWDDASLGPTWTFSIRLLALSTPERLTRLIIGPALSLLSARQQLIRNGKVDESLVKKALPDALLGEGLLRYRPHHLDGEPASIS
jgi:hypothetical protein